jgi:hypothetical protein
MVVAGQQEGSREHRVIPIAVAGERGARVFEIDACARRKHPGGREHPFKTTSLDTTIG